MMMMVIMYALSLSIAYYYQKGMEKLIGCFKLLGNGYIKSRCDKNIA